MSKTAHKIPRKLHPEVNILEAYFLINKAKRETPGVKLWSFLDRSNFKSVEPNLTIEEMKKRLMDAKNKRRTYYSLCPEPREDGSCSHESS